MKYTIHLATLLAVLSMPVSSATYSDTITNPNLLDGLPIKSETPGAVNPDVTQSNIHSTICVHGWSASVRPSSRYTSRLKREQLALSSKSTYAVLQDIEEDHLIPISSGGSPTDSKNIWPQPRLGLNTAAKKDKLEGLSHRMICSGKISLADAQKLFSDNWVVSYDYYYPKTTLHH